MRISEKGKKLIKKYEGCRLTAYRCPSNVLTIGYGHTGDVYEGQTITQAEADRLFDEDIKRYERPVQAYNVNQNQFDALTSFCYNCGAGALEDVMTSGDVTGTMAMYKHGNNRVVLPGLVRRRKEEIELYNTKGSMASFKYLNLHPHVATWRVYPLNVAPIIGNECGKLAPAQYGGLSYVIQATLATDIYQIKTQTFGVVKIYAPKDEDSLINTYPLY